MRFGQYLHTLGAALPFLAPAVLGELAPWQVAGLGSFSPSGRPGSSPDYFIHVNITDPDPTQSDPDPGVAPGKVYCQIVWRYPDVPYNQVRGCDVVDAASPTGWAWTVELVEEDVEPYPTTNFDLRWRAASSAPSEGPVQIWTGISQFKVGDNMQGLCAASGFCSWGLKPANTPVLVDVVPVSCHGSVEEALQGINCED